MKIYIDFDRTLFDCDKFLEDFYLLIDKYHIPKNIFRECQNQCKNEGFNPYNILREVLNYYLFDKKLYEEINILISKTKEYLYSDTLPFLEYLKMKNYQVTILTKGNSEYQREKILMAKIFYYYNDLIVTLKHKGELNLDYANGIFIDDNPNEIESIMKNNPQKIIRVKREKTKYFDVSTKKNVDTVATLNEIIKKELL